MLDLEKQLEHVIMTGLEPETYSALLTIFPVYGKQKQSQNFVHSVKYCMGTFLWILEN